MKNKKRDQKPKGICDVREFDDAIDRFAYNMKDAFRRSPESAGITYVAVRGFNFACEMGRRVGRDPNTRDALTAIAETLVQVGLSALHGNDTPATEPGVVSSVTLGGPTEQVDINWRPVDKPRRGRPRGKKLPKGCIVQGVSR